ncbi:hypothetical protein ACKKBF_B16335 [Auxenochlorella protothecoides x Auxenochlorella symbiontica]
MPSSWIRTSEHLCPSSKACLGGIGLGGRGSPWRPEKMRQDGHRLAFTSRIALRMTSAGCRALVTGVRCDVLHTPAGTWALDLRQWHAGSDAGLIPGKKGVRLGREQASALLAAAPLLDSKLNRKGAAGPSVVDHPTPASNAKPTAQHPGPSLTHAKPSPAPITVQPGPVSEAADRPPDAGPVELGSNKRAEVTTFKGRSLLSLREYYEKDGQLLPGKRGIALAADQVLALLTAAPQLTAGLERRDDSCRAQLSASRRAGVSAFKGRHSIDIREWYEKDGQERPGAKGLSLSQEQWGIFVAALPALQAAM